MVETPKMYLTIWNLTVSKAILTLKANMLLGQYHLLFNKDHSLAIPEPLRGLFTEGAYVTRGFEQNLLIMSDRVFREKCQRIMALNIADPKARLLFRLILGNASKLEIGKSGQVLFPQDLITFAGLEKNAILIGLGDYLEVWAPTQWEEQSILLQDAEANAERFVHLDLV